MNRYYVCYESHRAGFPWIVRPEKYAQLKYRRGKPYTKYSAAHKRVIELRRLDNAWKEIGFDMNEKQLKELWNSSLCNQFREAAYLAIIPGPAPIKGKPIKEVRIDFLTELLEQAFNSGVLAGFERGLAQCVTAE